MLPIRPTCGPNLYFVHVRIVVCLDSPAERGTRLYLRKLRLKQLPHLLLSKQPAGIALLPVILQYINSSRLAGTWNLREKPLRIGRFLFEAHFLLEDSLSLFDQVQYRLCGNNID